MLLHIGGGKGMEDILKEINKRIDDLIYADSMCEKVAVEKHDFESARYFQTAKYFTERARSVVLEIIESHIGDQP